MTKLKNGTFFIFLQITGAYLCSNPKYFKLQSLRNQFLLVIICCLKYKFFFSWFKILLAFLLKNCNYHRWKVKIIWHKEELTIKSNITTVKPWSVLCNSIFHQSLGSELISFLKATFPKAGEMLKSFFLDFIIGSNKELKSK